MQKTFILISVLLVVGCHSPTAPEMPAEPQAAGGIGPITSPMEVPADPHLWLGTYVGTWETGAGTKAVVLEIIDVREDLSPVRILGHTTVDGVTWEIRGELGKNRNANKWSWENTQDTAGCRAGDMTGHLEMVDEMNLEGFSKLTMIQGCMGYGAGVEPAKGGKGGGGKGGGKTSISGPCYLARDGS